MYIQGVEKGWYQIVGIGSTHENKQKALNY